MGGNKIVSYRNPNDLNELVNKSYVDQKVSQASSSVDLPDYLKWYYDENRIFPI